MELFLDGEATDAWTLAEALGRDQYGLALYIEPGAGDLYRAAYGTHGCDCTGRYAVRLYTPAEDEDAERLSPEARSGVLHAL